MKTHRITLIVLLLALSACSRFAAPTATPTPELSEPSEVTETPTEVASSSSASTAPQQPSPHTLLDQSDIARMKTWVTKDAWARDARDQIVKRANDYPAKYLRDFNLTAPDVPPTGGQWSQWYICPDGTNLRYEPTHTPPHFCPSDNKYYAAPTFTNRPSLYDEVIYQRRHLALADYARDLGLAYQLTGEKKYADSAVSILRTYAKLYPAYPQHDKDGKISATGGKATAQTLDEANWLINITWSYDLIYDTLSPTDRTQIADSVLRPAIANIRGNRAKLSNWQTWHNAAIAIVGLALGDNNLTKEAYTDPENGFSVQIQNGAAQDGFWWEGSWNYHFFTLEPMLYLAEMGARAGIDTFAQPNLRAMLTTPLKMAMPNLALPPFNDDSGTTLAGTARDWMYEIGYHRYHDATMLTLIDSPRAWQALLWGDETLPNASALPAQSTTTLPKAGFTVFRNGDGSDARYLAFKFGPHGGSHGHYDILSYIAFAFGKDLAFDPGTHSYAAASHEAWDKTTVAHNTVVVDEKNQAEATGNLQRSLSFSALSMAIANAGDVYPKTASITRTIVSTADYWVDLTRVTALDDKPHRFDWIYHNPGILSTPLATTPYTTFPKNNGYDYLTNTKSAITKDMWQATFDVSTGQPYGSVSLGRDGITASFTYTRTNEGMCGQIDYDFQSFADGNATYSTKQLSLPKELPTKIDVQVFANNSNNKLALLLIDATGEKFTKDVGAISGTGWKLFVFELDPSWGRGGGGNNNGTIDLPVSQVALQVSRTSNGTRAGSLLTREVALTFPSTGRMIVEDFAATNLAVKMAAVADTTVVLGNGIDQRNQPIPFAMARRQAKDTTFAAVLAPYRGAPRVEAIVSSRSGWQIVAPNLFTDYLLVADKSTGMKSAGSFNTDASLLYTRQVCRVTVCPLTILLLGDATKLDDSANILLTSTVPFTGQLLFPNDNEINITTQNQPNTTIRILAPSATKVTLNDKPVTFQRDRNNVVIDIR